MCCSSAALPPLPQSKIFRPATRASQIICPDCSMSLILERSSDCRVSRCSWSESVSRLAASFDEWLSTLLEEISIVYYSPPFTKALLTDDQFKFNSNAAAVPGTEAATPRHSIVLSPRRLLRTLLRRRSHRLS